MIKKINEGLRNNDLNGMLIPSISIDEYESKIDDTAMVVAFYAVSHDVAEDLNRFIQKSYVELIDTEISSAPDQEGNYIVFVEMMSNDKLPNSITNLCVELSSLVTTEHWNVSIRGVDEHKSMTTDEMEEYITANMPSNDSDEESIHEATNGIDTMRFRIKDQGEYQTVYERNNLANIPVIMSSEAVRGNRSIQSVLGNSWVIECLGESFAAHNISTNELMLISFKNIS